MAARDYYAVLGISPWASAEQVREAFLKRAEECHPDRGGTQAGLQEVCEAVEVLADAKKRALYDKARANPADSAAQNAWSQVQVGAAAANYPAQSSDLKSWLESHAKDVQQTRGGRILAGLMAGLIFGAVAGAVIGYFMQLNPGICAAIGVAAGACAGAFGAASNE